MRWIAFGVMTITALWLGTGEAPAQQAMSAPPTAAEIRTRVGQVLRLADPTLEVFYTLIPPRPGAGQPTFPGAAPGGGPVAATGPISVNIAAGRSSPFAGSLQAASRSFDTGDPEALQGRHQRDFVRLFRQGAEIQVPLAEIATLTFSRVPIVDSALPPYVATGHFRYAASAVLRDGSRVDADEVNLGTASFRGMTPQGKVDVPWREIDVITFSR
jgi:hypothetical protein